MQFFLDAYLTLPNDNEIEICVFGPGYGESIVMHIPSIGWGVVDSCLATISGHKVNLPFQYLNEILAKNGFPKLAFIVLTHPHEDHYRGIDKIVLNYPGGVERVCRYNGESIKELKTYIAKQKAGNSDPLPGLPGVFRAFEVAKKNGAQFRHLGELSLVVEKRNADIPDYGQTDIRIIALGPTALSQQQYTNLLYKAFPKPGGPVKPLKDSAHNLISVGLLVEAGDLRIILSSDIENDHKGKMGWQAIINNTDLPNLNCGFIKVAHHGSPTGYCENAWNKHCAVQPPISVVTPFVHGSVLLPDGDVLKKIKEKSKKVGVTNNELFEKKLSKHFSRSDAMAINQKTRSFKIQKKMDKVGFIRTRYKLDGTPIETLAASPASWV